MNKTADEFSLRDYLAKRLMPGTLAIAFIISFLFPVTYFVVGKRTTKQTAMIYASEFSYKIYGVIVNYPTLWKYQAQKYLQALHEFVPYKNVTDIHVYDDKGQQITEYGFKDSNRHEHGYFSSDKGMAPIIFNNRVVGTVEVYVSLKPVLTSTFLILLVSLAVGTGLAYFAYVFPIRVVKKAEEKLRESESKFRDLAELLPETVFETDDKGNILFFNRRALENLGYTQDDFNKGLHAFQMFIPEDLDRIGINIQRILSGEVLYGIEYTAIRKDGTLFPVHLSACPIVHEDKITGIRGIAIDISELKQAEDEIKKAGQEWEHTFDSITAPIMILDTHHKIIKANKAMADKLGVTPSKTIGLTCYEAVHDKNEPPSFCPHAALLVDGQTHSTEVYEEKLGGHYIITVSPLFAPDGTLYGSVHYAADITERKRIEQEQQKFVTLIENSSDFIAIASLGGDLLYINRAGRKLVGLDSAEEARTKMVADFFFEKDLNEFEKSIIPGNFWQGEFRLRHFKTGQEIPVELTRFLIRDIETNQPIARATIIRDITERKLAELEIRKLNKELEVKVKERTKQLMDAQEELVRKEKLATLGQLSGSVGHELRNPLGVMSNAVYYLKTVMSDADENVKEYLDMIKSEINNSERIISDLLDFSRVKTPQAESITINELVQQSLGKCTVPDNVTLRLALPDTIPKLEVDPLQMGQVFQNLITNGIQAMPDGGELRISARRVAGVKGQGSRENIEAGQTPRVKESQKEETTCPYPDGSSLVLCYLTLDPDEDFIEISVTDTGEGIAPENMNKLFQPLFTTKAKGIGLGLVVCKNLVEANGGRIELASELGKGTTFTVVLPVGGNEK